MAKKTSLASVLKNGILNENPIFRLVLGMCPTLAVTKNVSNALGMGFATMFVLVCSNIVISVLKNFIPDKVRIPSYVVIIASFVTIVELVLKAYFPAHSESLGIFIPLIVVNCIILARAESFANRNNVVRAAADGLGMGLGFLIGLFLMGSIREILGAGTFLGMSLFGASFEPMMLFALPPGGFITLGLLIGSVNVITSRKSAKIKTN